MTGGASYVSKPIRSAELAHAIADLPPADEAGQPADSPASGTADGAFDAGLALAGSVHGFTGSLGTFGAQGAYEIGVELERRARAGQTDGLDRMHARFAAAVGEVRQALTRLRDDAPT